MHDHKESGKQLKMSPDIVVNGNQVLHFTWKSKEKLREKMK